MISTSLGMRSLGSLGPCQLSSSTLGYKVPCSWSKETQNFYSFITPRSELELYHMPSAQTHRLNETLDKKGNFYLECLNNTGWDDWETDPSSEPLETQRQLKFYQRLMLNNVMKVISQANIKTQKIMH